jgi:hypothetical protein
MHKSHSQEESEPGSATCGLLAPLALNYHGSGLPAPPHSKALDDFLVNRRMADPDHFTGLSLTKKALVSAI